MYISKPFASTLQGATETAERYAHMISVNTGCHVSDVSWEIEQRRGVVDRWEIVKHNHGIEWGSGDNSRSGTS